MCREAQLCEEHSVCPVEQRHQHPSSPHISHQSSIICRSQTCLVYRSNSAARRGQIGCWVRGEGRWWWFKHTLWCRQCGSWCGLSCKACTRISCNSLSYTDGVRGGRCWVCQLSSHAFQNLGERMSTENTKRAYWKERKGRKTASLCNSSSLCYIWLFTKAALETELSCPLYLLTSPEITPGPCHACPHYIKVTKSTNPGIHFCSRFTYIQCRYECGGVLTSSGWNICVIDEWQSRT